MAEVFIDPVIQRLERQEQSLSSAQILAQASTAAQRCAGKRSIRHRYVYWQTWAAAKGQKHVLHLDKNKTRPNTLFWHRTSVLRQQNMPTPLSLEETEACSTDFITPSLLCREFCTHLCSYMHVS